MHPPSRRRKIPCIANWRRCRGRASITNGTIRRARPMPTCTTRRRACMISCAPITITRARTGKTTRRIRCKSWSAGELAKLPTYYVMDLAKDMAATVARGNAVGGGDRRQPMAAGQRAFVLQRRICAHRISGRPAMVSLRHLGRIPRANCRPGRAAPSTCPPASSPASRIGAPISVPACSRRCRSSACTKMIGCHLVDGAGHWVQQEQPAEVSRLLLQFLQQAKRG